ncbi:MAG: glycosyltransferase family 4 protein [Actinomycetota bacterium]
MEFHQILVSASPGDAITNAALELRALLGQVTRSHIFARYIDPALGGEVFPLGSYPARLGVATGKNVLLYHASIGEPHVASFLLGRPERIVLVYHNISPADSFRPYDPVFAGLLEEGRRELAGLADRVALALAVSAYNAEELRALGYRDVRVAPLIVDASRLRSVDSDAGMAGELERRKGPLILFVGQLLPHKRPDLLLQAYHVLITYLVPDAHLVLAGASRLEPYRGALEWFIRELNLFNATLMGSVSLGALVALYRRADVFVTLSEHEGFCVPLLEAMTFDVPVIARAHAAVGETLGDGGLLLPPDDDPLLAAEAMAAVTMDRELGDRLISRGRRRLAHFDPDAARATLLQHLLSLV